MKTSPKSNPPDHPTPGQGPGGPDAAWLESGTASLSPQGCVEFMDDALAAWLGSSNPVGKSFPELLRELCPDGVADLRARLATAGPAFRVSYRCGADSMRGLRLDAVRNAAGWMLVCRSELPLSAELAQGGWREELSGGDEGRELFVRLMKAESQVERLSARWPGVLFTQRPDLSFQYASPQIEVLTGLTSEDFARSPRRFWDVVHEADADDVEQHIKRTAASPDMLAATFRIRHAHSGKITYILEHRQATRSSSGLVLSYEGVWLDITRQTIAEKRLSAAAWKETLAMLTMGLAHDFNNILGGISGLSESFVAQMAPDHPFYEGLSLIRQNSLHASQLVHRIMSLHRAKTGERSYHNLNEIVTEFTDLIQKIIPRRINVSNELDPESLPVYADAVELRQMVLNFALNAADAMPDRGQLTLRTSRHETWPQPPNYVGFVPRLPCICLEFIDTGSGIPERHLPLVFDPFFTTKPMNKGSGLGLYNARLSAEKHQGGISVESVEGRGTRFSLWLPQADFTEAERAEAEAGPRRTLILLGEPGLLMDSTAEFLRVNAYSVVKSSSRDQVRDLLLAEDTTFAAVFILTSLRESGLGGFVREIQHRHPAVKIILQITAGTADELDSELMNCGHLVITHGVSEAEILSGLESLVRNPA